MNELPSVESDRVKAVEKALDIIVGMQNGLIPVIDYDYAKGVLRRKGGSFLAKVCAFDGSELQTELVPIRVIDTNTATNRFGCSEWFGFWHGRQIANLHIGKYRNMHELVEKVADLLLTAINRFVRRLQKQMHYRRPVSLRRQGRRHNGYMHVHSPRMCH